MSPLDGPSAKLSSEYTKPSQGPQLRDSTAKLYSSISLADSGLLELPLMQPLRAGMLSIK